MFSYLDVSLHRDQAVPLRPQDVAERMVDVVGSYNGDPRARVDTVERLERALRVLKPIATTYVKPPPKRERKVRRGECNAVCALACCPPPLYIRIFKHRPSMMSGRRAMMCGSCWGRPASRRRRSPR